MSFSVQQEVRSGKRVYVAVRAKEGPRVPAPMVQGRSRVNGFLARAAIVHISQLSSKESDMYWVILKTNGSTHVRITCEVSMQLAQQWITTVLAGCTEPVRIELLDGGTGEGVHIEIDEHEMRAEKTQRAMGAHFMASWPAVARRDGSGAPQPLWAPDT